MSPGWPDNYEDQLRCVYKFIGRPDQRVSVKFLHFDVKGIPPRSVTFLQKSIILVLLSCSWHEQRQRVQEKNVLFLVMFMLYRHVVLFLAAFNCLQCRAMSREVPNYNHS